MSILSRNGKSIASGDWNKANPERVAYISARRRCTCPKSKDYVDYGGRGIKFMFTTFEQFFAELGKRPNGKSLDRINNDGNYEVGNVRWATKSQQRKNRRRK
jgi:hypothetical protein